MRRQLRRLLFTTLSMKRTLDGSSSFTLIPHSHIISPTALTSLQPPQSLPHQNNHDIHQHHEHHPTHARSSAWRRPPHRSPQTTQHSYHADAESISSDLVLFEHLHLPAGKKAVAALRTRGRYRPVAYAFWHFDERLGDKTARTICGFLGGSVQFCTELLVAARLHDRALVCLGVLF